MKNGIPLGSSKILVTAIWVFKKKKSPYSLMCLLALFEKTAIVILKGSKIYHRINLKLHSSV